MDTRRLTRKLGLAWAGRRLLIAALLFCVALTPGKADAQDAGFQQLVLNDDEFTTLLEADLPSTDPGGSKKPAPPPSNQIVVLKTLRGVRDAGVPSWLQQDVLEEQGYSSFSELTDAELDALIPTITASVDAMGAVDDASLAPDSGSQKISLCSKKRSERVTTIDKDFDSIRPVLDDREGSDFDAELRGEFLSRGTFKVDVHYTLKSRCGIRYGAEFRYAEIFVDAVLDGGYGLSGTAKRALSQELFKRHFSLWNVRQSWWLYFFQFETELELAIDVGVKLDVRTETTLAAMYEATGSVGLTWYCNSSTCAKTRNNVDLEFEEPDPQLGYAASVRATVTPYVDVNFTADLDMYYGAVDIAEAKLGVVGAVPLSVHGYVGNLCSDADGDGHRENVRGLSLDIRAELYAYMELELGDKDLRYDIDLNLFGWKKDVKGSLQHDDDFKVSVYSRPLFFRDLLDGGSSTFEPVVSAVEPVATHEGVTLFSRLCHPFSDALTFEVDWGDGSPFYVGKGGYVAHDWPGAGTYLVRARLVEDAAGREFEQRWTLRQITTQVAPVRWLGNGADGTSTFHREQGVVYERDEDRTVFTFTIWNDSDPNFVFVNEAGRDFNMALPKNQDTFSSAFWWDWESSQWIEWRKFKYEGP